MHELPMSVSANLVPPASHAESIKKRTTLAMTVVATVLMVVYFVISVLAVSH